MWQKITDVFKNLFSEKNLKLTLIVAVGIFLLLWLKGCSDTRNAVDLAKREKAIADQNIRALTDSIRYEKTRSGDIEAVKSSFVSKLEDLEKLNKDLYAEVKNEVGKVKSLIKANAEIGRDSVKLSNTLKKYPDGKTFGLTFNDNYEDTALTWKLKGESKFQLENNTIIPGLTIIEENKIRVKLVMGFKENKDNFEVFARSASPLVKFNDLDGTIIIPKKPDITMPPVKKKNFGIGPNISVGVGANLKPSIFLGVGIQYNIFKF